MMLSISIYVCMYVCITCVHEYVHKESRRVDNGQLDYARHIVGQALLLSTHTYICTYFVCMYMCACFGLIKIVVYFYILRTQFIRKMLILPLLF